MFHAMEQRTSKNVNNCLNTTIYSYLERSGGQSSNLYLNVVHFSTPVFIMHLWKLKTAVFPQRCLVCAVLLAFNLSNGVTDTLESSTILIFLIQVKGIYTQRVTLIKTGN
jgi:hypothetical protein